MIPGETGGVNVLTAEFDEAIKGLIILVFILGPVLRKLLGRLASSAERPATDVPPTRPQPSPRRRTPVTWEELMRGAGPEPPDVDAQAAPEPALSPAPAEESWTPLASSFDVGRLGRIPEEGSLEDVGAEDVGMEEAPLVDLGAGGLRESVSSAWGAERTMTRARAMRRQLGGGGWRRAVLLAEVLGSPLALREDWSHPGPPLGQGARMHHG